MCYNYYHNKTSDRKIHTKISINLTHPVYMPKISHFSFNSRVPTYKLIHTFIYLCKSNNDFFCAFHLSNLIYSQNNYGVCGYLFTTQVCMAYYKCLYTRNKLSSTALVLYTTIIQDYQCKLIVGHCTLQAILLGLTEFITDFTSKTSKLS